MNAVGVRESMMKIAATAQQKTPATMYQCLPNQWMIEPYFSRSQSKKRLNATNGLNFVGSCCGFRNTAASAGESDSELMALSAIEKAIVSANWL